MTVAVDFRIDEGMCSRREATAQAGSIRGSFQSPRCVATLQIPPPWTNVHSYGQGLASRGDIDLASTV